MTTVHNAYNDHPARPPAELAFPDTDLGGPPRTSLGSEGSSMTLEAAPPAPAPTLEISNAIARLHKEQIGRGPDNVRTLLAEDVVVCVLTGGLTRAERTLVAAGEQELVAASRAALSRALRPRMTHAVECTVGRPVRSVTGGIDLSADLQTQVFVLESPSADEPESAATLRGTDQAADV
jgi:uncharacterized protein YbcI